MIGRVVTAHVSALAVLALLGGCGTVVGPATGDAGRDLQPPGDRTAPDRPDGAVPDAPDAQADDVALDRPDESSLLDGPRDAPHDEAPTGPCESTPSEVVEAATNGFALGAVRTRAGCLWRLRDDPTDQNSRRIAELVPNLFGVRSISYQVSLCAVVGDVARSLRDSFGDPLYPPIPDAIAVGAFNQSMCAIRSDRTVWCTGRFSMGGGEFINFTEPTRVSGVERAVHVLGFDGAQQRYLAFLADGRVVSWRYELIAEDLPVLRGAAPPTGVGGRQICFRMPEGTVRCAGWDRTTACGVATPYEECLLRDSPLIAGLSGIVQVATAQAANFALRPDGRLMWWGLIHDADPPVFVRVPEVFPDLTDVVQIWGGGTDLLALRRDGTLWSYTVYSENRGPALNRVPGFGPP